MWDVPAHVQLDSQVLTVPDFNHPPHLLVNISTFLPWPWAQPSWLYNCNLSGAPSPLPHQVFQISPRLPLSQSDSIFLPFICVMICPPQAAQKKWSPPQCNHGYPPWATRLLRNPGDIVNKWIQRMTCTSKFVAIRPSSDVCQSHSKSFYSLISVLICHCWQQLGLKQDYDLKYVTYLCWGCS